MPTKHASTMKSIITNIRRASCAIPNSMKVKCNALADTLYSLPVENPTGKSKTPNNTKNGPTCTGRTTPNAANQHRAHQRRGIKFARSSSTAPANAESATLRGIQNQRPGKACTIVGGGTQSGRRTWRTMDGRKPPSWLQTKKQRNQETSCRCQRTNEKNTFLPWFFVKAK